MSPDRQRIQRSDFPTRLRGYDRAAVNAHLRALADELEARAGSVAGAAGEQVRAVLAAAEASAAEIRATAQHEAQALHAQASAALESAHGLASREQRDRAERVAASSGATLERLDALRGELAELLDALGRPAPTAEPPPVAAALAPAAEQPPAPGDDDERDLVPDPAAPAPHEADEETEAGARLVALDLALSGAPREQADRYLAEHFAPLGDRGALLDEVYAAAGHA
jgi:DivIVA domain-containing protein